MADERQDWTFSRAASREELFDRMLSLLRHEVPEVPTDPAFIDPALKLILKALALELAEVYQEISTTGDRVFKTLLRRLLTVPRGPVPAQTVVHFKVAEPGMTVGPEVGLGCTVTRPAADGTPTDHNLEFRPGEARRLGEYAVSAMIRVDSSGSASLDTLPPPGNPDAPFTKHWRTEKPGRPYLVFCVDSRLEQPSDPTPPVFIDGPATAVRAALWGRWSPIGQAWKMTKEWSPARWLPTNQSADVPEVLTYRADLEEKSGPYAGQWVSLPLTSTDHDVVPNLLRETGVDLPGPAGKRWWWQVEFAGDPSIDITGLRLYCDCLPVWNRHLFTKGEIVPDLTRQAIVLPIGFDALTRIEQVLDLGAGISYQRADTLDSVDAPHSYVLRLAPDGESAAVFIQNPPRGFESSRIEVQYSTTLGPIANGIGPGAITKLLTPEPGIQSATNLVPTTGGKPARSVEGVEEEIRGAMRHHGRAVAFQDYRDLALALGAPFVTEAKVEPGVRKSPRGMERCVEVSAVVQSGSFISEVERDTFRFEMERRLTARSPVGTIVHVGLHEQGSG